jgi:hypothetical protein
VELSRIVHRDYPGLPILLATGYADLPEGQNCDLPRLSKPYRQETLKEEIDRLLPRQAAAHGHRDQAGTG